ncbi:hypothetical protein GCM10027589_45200 [Actinocorallia lasiicapitis]
MTLLLNHTDLNALLDPAACLAALEDGFRHAGREGARHRADLPFPGTAAVLMPGLLPGTNSYTVKVNAKFPGATPALRGLVCLFDGHDGTLLSVQDSATLTAWRTGLSAALATHRLAPEGERIGVIGAGAQAELMLRGLAELRSWAALTVHDTDGVRAEGFAGRHGGVVVEAPGRVAGVADIVLIATWSRRPLLALADARPGQHFTTLGVDEPGKAELAGDLLAGASLVVDDLALARATGVLHGLPDVTAVELRDVLDRPASRDRPSVYAAVGLPWQDLALASVAHAAAVRGGVGTEFDFLG